MTLFAFIITSVKYHFKLLSAKFLLPMISSKWTLYDSTPACARSFHHGALNFEDFRLPYIIFPFLLAALCLTLESWMGSKMQSTAGYFPDLCSVFRGAGDSGVAKSINKQFCFSHVSLHVLLVLIIVIIIYHDFLPTPRRGSHVKSGKTHTQSSRYTP